MDWTIGTRGAIELWNMNFAPGTKVIYFPIFQRYEGASLQITKGKAFLLANTPCVHFECGGGAYSIRNCLPLSQVDGLKLDFERQIEILEEGLREQNDYVRRNENLSD